jgi:hypothetical protein
MGYNISSLCGGQHEYAEEDKQGYGDPFVHLTGLIF